ncbi:NAD(P)/FAD-dependent oxidoreductase [Terriglobus albidus]|uniref:NADH:ubiquinone reductase (non-electrogenic) n=1 Tax=Terriglobus albidus TaxID=1592106 RepID=A0A5B9EB33_9BACT|nr:NAD(P)/FAD-dependent oxidoreductase [Terriglobus albidus]QEE28894.1 NAD(P)/FAD-dependent oxidoreductase [Terriglobus albidus]
MSNKIPRVVIVGGGFGGLATAKALRGAPVSVLLVDRNNHHVFQPLLYQVATSVLAPGQIAAPIRGLLAAQENTSVMLGNVTGVNAELKRITIDANDQTGVEIDYDYLVLATGATHSYFGHDEFAAFAPGLKSLADAESLRNHILTVFEKAELEDDAPRRHALMTFVLVGAGPTGVEMASAIAVMVRTTLRKDFRNIDPATARIVLADMGQRPLGTFAEELSEAAKLRLLQLGVEVRLGKPVQSIDEDGAVVGDERIPSKTVIWTAGVAPSPAGKWLGCEVDRAGRVRIRPDLTVSNRPEVYVIGDTASLDQDGRPLPGVAQVAMQQGRYVAKAILRKIEMRPPLSPFRYFDKGNLAVVGKNFAVLQSRGVKISGFIAWLVWALIHIQFLADSSLRFSVFLQWLMTYVSGRRGDRLIIQGRKTS